VADEVLEIRRQRQDLKDERETLTRNIEALKPWGDFRLPPEDDLGGLRLWFYTLRHHRLADLETTDLAWKQIASDNQFLYVTVVSKDEPVGVPGTPVELDRRPLSELQARLEQVDETLESLQQQRFVLTRFTHLLARDLDEADDATERMEALHRLVEDDHVFAIQGWAPHSTLDAVRDFAREHKMALVVEDPDPSEQPPTLLKNPEAVAGASGAVTFYITPDYHAWDPTWVVFFSFSFFFAMIMADAGYGLVLGGLLLLMWGKLSGSENGVRFRNLLVAVIVAAVIYGIAIGSFFGVTVPGLDRLQLKLAGEPLVNNREAMMFISVAIGALHLSLANLITAWRYRGSSRALSCIGWAAVLLGGLVYGLASVDMGRLFAVELGISESRYEVLAPHLMAGGKAAVIIGLMAVLLFTSARPLFSTKVSDWGWRVLEGLQGLTGISKVFGDTLSYLRLFALGLASAQLAVTFNDLAKGTLEIPGLGILLAILILIVGHGINLLLGIMGGVVHGLRLNCIEFFNWSLTDEGYPFRAFCKKAGR
jgi:V/A-type H+-transporting ATPase subunit I